MENDFTTLEGRWELFDLGEAQTLGRFGSRINVGPALPAFLQDFATRKKLPEAMQNVRRWVVRGDREGMAHVRSRLQELRWGTGDARGGALALPLGYGATHRQIV